MSAPFRLRGYSVEELIGTGSSGEVWRARVTSSGEPVALKRLTVRDAAQAQAAQDEAALLCALDHPHLVRLHALVPAAGSAVLVLDLADGGSLAGLLATRGRLTPGEVITAVAPVAAALAYLHDQGVVHGDVSPANVLFTTAGVPLLADVGVARLTGDDREVASTPAYVDPGVAGGCVPGPRSDVFMLGAVALHALTGRPVWDGESAEQSLALAASGRLEHVRRRLDDAAVPEPMARVVARALELDPHRRGTAADLALDLRHSGEPVAVELGAGRERAPAPVRGPRHAARPAADRCPPAPATPATPATPWTDPARPEFERPSAVPGGTGLAPPTRLVGPRPRPVIPRPQARRGRRRALLIALVGTALALLATAGAVWASTGGAPRGHPDPARSASPSAHSPATSSPPGSSPPGSRAPSTSRPAGRAPGSRPPGRSRARSAAPSVAGVAWPASGSDATWGRVLAQLDDLRRQAFATRDASLLARMYASPALQRADAALLWRIVPAGCSLTGVRTRYTAVHAVTTAVKATVTATATLPASRLRCAGHDRGRAAGVGPITLRIELVPVAGAARIVTQRRAPPSQTPVR